MKVYFHKFYILIISSELVSFFGLITGFNRKTSAKPVMGIALFPCIIILRNLTHRRNKEWINHEKIHLQQSFESLGLFNLLSTLEYLYARIVLKYSHMEAYKYEAIEQEAYLNQMDDNYLKSRKLFSTIKYFKHKVNYHTDEEYNVVLD